MKQATENVQEGISVPCDSTTFLFPYLSTPLVIFSFENRPALFPGQRS